jgi:hypothetical protein
MNYPFVHTVLAAAVLSTFAFNAHAAPSVEERMAALEARLNAVESENQSLKTQLKSTEQKVVAASEQVEKVAAAAPSAKASWTENNRIGGYGELHYNNLDGEGGASDKDELDLHRFVLFFGHEFNERMRFFSELEIEHSIAGEGKKGEIELEQAYLEFDFGDHHRAKAGVFLVPVGILNETHEPATFYGVERNPVEKDIIPATWWGGGAALSGQLGAGFGYDLALQEGLATTAAKSYKPRDGRQKTSEARATDFATTARLKWTGLPGIELAGSIQHQSDITQGLDATAGSAQLYELHGILNRGAFGLKALYAQWNLDGSGPAAIGADKQAGWYIEPAFRINEQWGVFARYNAWDNKAGDAADSAKQQTDLGVNYWPHADVVVKADYQTQDNDDGKNQNGFNLGVGYQF